MTTCRITFVLAWMATCLVSAGRAPAQTEILTFDDLSPDNFQVPNGYGGFEWSNFDYAASNNAAPNPNGYNNAVVSPNNVAYNDFAHPATISGGVFNLNSAYLTAGWNDGLQVEVQGFLGSAEIYDQTYAVNTTGPTLIHFNYLGIDAVTFISSGGIPNPAYVGNGGGMHFAMDNLSVTPVPEPSAFALVGLGMVTRLARCRRKR